MNVTIRPSTPEERRDKFPPLRRGARRVAVPKYVACNPGTGNIYTVFGLPQGGATRAEAVFWAERLASKNDLDYVPPPGWEHITGRLPS